MALEQKLCTADVAGSSTVSNEFWPINCDGEEERRKKKKSFVTGTTPSVYNFYLRTGPVGGFWNKKKKKKGLPFLRGVQIHRERRNILGLSYLKKMDRLRAG